MICSLALNHVGHFPLKGQRRRNERWIEDSLIYTAALAGGKKAVITHINVKALEKKGGKSLNSTHKENIYSFSKVS